MLSTVVLSNENQTYRGGEDVTEERFQNIEPGDILLAICEETKETIAYLIMYDGKWRLINLSRGSFSYNTETKKELYEIIGGYTIDIIPRKLIINQVNMRLGGKFKYPVIAH